MMKRYRVKFKDRWFDAEEFNHTGMAEPAYLIAGHVFKKSDFEAYYVVSNKEKEEGD